MKRMRCLSLGILFAVLFSGYQFVFSESVSSEMWFDDDAGFYNYGPCVIQTNETTRYVYYNRNESVYGGTNQIVARVGTCSESGEWTWGAQQTMLTPSESGFDSLQVSDPSVVAGTFSYQNEAYSYVMAYTASNSADGQNHQIGMAVSKSPMGPWVRVNAGTPWIAFTQAQEETAQWGYGQPSLVSVNQAGKVMLFYSVGSTSGTTTIAERWDLSNLASPAREFSSELPRKGLLDLEKSPSDFMNNADFGYDPIYNRFLAVSDCHPNPTDAEPTFLSSHLRVVYLSDLPVSTAGFEPGDVFEANTANAWSTMKTIKPSDTGFPRNHNAGIVTDAYGWMLSDLDVEVVFTRGLLGAFPDSNWSYRIGSKSYFFAPDSGIQFQDAKGIYNYGATVIQTDANTRFVYYNSNASAYSGVNQIVVRKGTRSEAGEWNWEEKQIALTSAASGFDALQVGDPSVIAGTFAYENDHYAYLMAYTGCADNTGQNNAVGLAVAKNPLGPWIRLSSNPIVPFTRDDTHAESFQWGCGQPSLVSVDKEGTVLLFYSVGTATGTTTKVERWDFSDLSSPTRAFSEELPRQGLTNLAGTPNDFMNNADFGYDPTHNRFFAVSDCHPNPTDAEPTFLSSHLRVVYLSDLPASTAGFEPGDVFEENTANAWSTMKIISSADTGFPRNHNAGLVTDAYGWMLSPDDVEVVFTRGLLGTVPESNWSYRIYLKSYPFAASEEWFGDAGQIYNYCPVVIQTDASTRYVYYCSNMNSGEIVDYIAVRKGDRTPDGNWTWGEKQIALAPSEDGFDALHVCDPAVVAGEFAYQNETYSYLMAYTGSVSPDSQNNEVGLAAAKSPLGPWVRIGGGDAFLPFCRNPAYDNEFQWGYGQPSLVSADKSGTVLLFYSSGNIGDPSTKVERWNFSNLENPVREFSSELPTQGLVDLEGTENDFMNNGDFGYDPVNNRFVSVSDCHPNPRVAEPVFISSHFRVTYLSDFDNAAPGFLPGDVFQTPNNHTWSTLKTVGPSDTGFPRNHNTGLVTDQYGWMLHQETVEVAFSCGFMGPFPDLSWTYRIHSLVVS